jgi:hypothetical protein
METLRDRVSKLTLERDALTDKVDDLGDQNQDLRVTVEALRGQLRLAEEGSSPALAS